MIIEKSIRNVNYSEALVARITDHLRRRGFRQLKSKNELIFSRGTKRGFFNTLWAARWYCRITIRFLDNHSASILFDIIARWRVIFPLEKRLWVAEFNYLKDIILLQHNAIGRDKTRLKILFFINLFFGLKGLIFVFSMLFVIVGPGIIIGLVLQYFYHFSEGDGLWIGFLVWYPILITACAVILIKYVKSLKNKKNIHKKD